MHPRCRIHPSLPKRHNIRIYEGAAAQNIMGHPIVIRGRDRNDVRMKQCLRMHLRNRNDGQMERMSESAGSPKIKR